MEVCADSFVVTVLCYYTSGGSARYGVVFAHEDERRRGGVWDATSHDATINFFDDAIMMAGITFFSFVVAIEELREGTTARGWLTGVCKR